MWNICIIFVYRNMLESFCISMNENKHNLPAKNKYCVFNKSWFQVTNMDAFNCQYEY